VARALSLLVQSRPEIASRAVAPLQSVFLPRLLGALQAAVRATSPSGGHQMS
jgi:hypothetical protein